MLAKSNRNNNKFYFVFFCELPSFIRLKKAQLNQLYMTFFASQK